MNQQAVKVGVAISLLCISVIHTCVRSSDSDLPKLNTTVHEDVGRRLAEEAGHFLESKGRLVLLQPKASFDMPPVAAQVRSFKKHLPRGVHIIGREVVVLEQMGTLDGLLTPERYRQLAADYPQAGLIVSFVGLGGFDKARVQELRSLGLPPLAVVTMNGTVPDRLLDSGIVQLAVQSRFGPSGMDYAQDVVEEEDAFARSYVLVTAKHILPSGSR